MNGKSGSVSRKGAKGKAAKGNIGVLNRDAAFAHSSKYPKITGKKKLGDSTALAGVNPNPLLNLGSDTPLAYGAAYVCAAAFDGLYVLRARSGSRFRHGRPKYVRERLIFLHER